jgi:hypothetical protein
VRATRKGFALEWAFIASLLQTRLRGGVVNRRLTLQLLPASQPSRIARNKSAEVGIGRHFFTTFGYRAEFHGVSSVKIV